MQLNIHHHLVRVRLALTQSFHKLSLRNAVFSTGEKLTFILDVFQYDWVGRFKFVLTLETYGI